MCNRWVLVVLLAALAAAPLKAAENEEAQSLCDEAFETIRKNATASVPPKEYAIAMLKLEKALDLLDKAGQSNTSLAQDAASAHFWAGKSSNIQILNELDKLRKSGGLPPRPPRERKVAERGSGASGLAGLEADGEAAKAFADAQSYAESHKEDEFKVALRWFQVAGEYSGTVYSLKALEQARKAQDRFMAKAAMQKEDLPDTPEMKPVRAGDELALAGDLEKAISKYKESLRLSNTPVAQRRLGHACFMRAQQIKDEILPKWQELQPRYVEAWNAAWTQTGNLKQFRNDYPPYAAAQKEYVWLEQQLSKAFSYYQEGRWAFESVLKNVAGGKDLDSAAHVALCFVAIPAERRQATTRLASFLKEYEPKNEVERMLYAYCKIELENLQQQTPKK